MNDQSEREAAIGPEGGFGRGSRLAGDPVLMWHLVWALGAAAGAGLLLVALPKASLLGLLVMLIIGLPGLIGALWRPSLRQAPGFLVVWAAAAAMAAVLEGGVRGPLAVWCVLPAIVTIALEGPWAWGLGLSVAALLLAAAANAAHLAWRPPTSPVDFWLALVAVATTAAGAVGALAVARRRAIEARRGVEAELASFQGLMGDLPDLALAMDAEGRTQAVFGQALDGVDLAALHQGLVEVAEPADRPKLEAAIREAAAAGHARIAFSPDVAGAPRLLAAIQRTGQGGFTAILREAPPAPQRIALDRVQRDVASPPPAAPAIDPSAVAALEARLKQAEAGRAKAESDAAGRARFLANMSHELRTPLNAIMGFSDIMRSRLFGELQPKYAEYAELIHESGRHLLDLINDVLDMSKIEAHRYELSREVFDGRDAVNAALRLLRLQADDAGVSLRGILPSQPVEVDADRRAIKQIVLNLVSNALKFTPRGGLVTVTADAAAGAFDIAVADSGVGIAPEDLERLGRPYEQAGGAADRAMGTGLGLSLVRSFAELHGGAMTIESRLGEGTAVTVRLPVLIAPPVETEAPPAPSAVLAEAPVEPAPEVHASDPETALPTEPEAEPAVEPQASASEAPEPEPSEPEPMAIEPVAAPPASAPIDVPASALPPRPVAEADVLAEPWLALFSRPAVAQPAEIVPVRHRPVDPFAHLPMPKVAPGGAPDPEA